MLCARRHRSILLCTCNQAETNVPGNINILVMKLDVYRATLQETGGRVNEFVNPKYVDESKTSFKSPTRLECMMQDFPLLLAPDAKVHCHTRSHTSIHAPARAPLHARPRTRTRRTEVKHSPRRS